MARQMGWALAALVVVAAAQVTTASQEHQRPPEKQQDQKDGRQERGPWWRQGHPTAKEIGVTADQTAAIDRIFGDYIHKARPLREEVNQLDKALNRMMEENLVEITTIEQESGRIEKKRAELNKMRTVLLYSIRRVLTADQRLKLEKHEAERRKQDGDRRR